MFGSNARHIATIKDCLQTVISIQKKQVEINLMLGHRLDVLEARAEEVLAPCNCCSVRVLDRAES
jgi:hypothetical protein